MKSISAKVTPELKEQAEEILKQRQLPMSATIELFLQQIVIQRRIPFDITVSKVAFKLWQTHEKGIGRRNSKEY